MDNSRLTIRGILLSLLAINVVFAQSAETAEKYSSAFGVTGISYSQKFWPELTGSSVKMALVEAAQGGSGQPDSYDCMPDLEQLSTSGIKLANIYPNNNFSGTKSTHATMIAGLLWGHDPENNALGIVPEATVSVYNAQWFALYCAMMHQNETIDFDVDILSLSWGD